MVQLARVSVKISRSNLKAGNPPDKEEVLEIIDSPTSKEQFLSPAAEFLWHMIKAEVKTPVPDQAKLNELRIV